MGRATEAPKRAHKVRRSEPVSATEGQKRAHKVRRSEPVSTELDRQREDEEALRQHLEAEGVGHRYHGPTAAELVDASLTGAALSPS